MATYKERLETSAEVLWLAYGVPSEEPDSLKRFSWVECQRMASLVLDALDHIPEKM